jgi:hypothetical protein
MNAPPQTHGAYELKFALPEALVGPVTEWARAHVPADPHGDVPGGDGYSVNSLYFDSAGLDVFHRRGGFGERKYRVRRYGAEGVLYLEEKEKIRGWVRKRRTVIAEADLGRIGDEDPTWEGAWFARRLREDGLAPRTQVAYRRLARIGESEGGPIRLTLDRQVRCVATTDPALPELCPGEGVSLARNILELKFGGALPALYKRLVGEFGLEPDGGSKYRLSVAATGQG